MLVKKGPPPSDSLDMAVPEISLVALFYNEEGNAEGVIRDAYRILKQIGVPFEIVATQNGSTDRTPEILARLKTEIRELRIVVIPVNQGAGYGAVKGLYAAIGDDVVGVSGDGQVDQDLIPRMYEFKRQCGADIAYGRRIKRPDGFTRALISRSYNLMMRWVFGLQSKDVNGPPKIISRKVLEAMQLKSDDHFLECEMMLKAQRMGLTMCSIDVEFHSRETGESSIGWRDCLDYLRNLLTVLISRNDPWGIRSVYKVLEKNWPMDPSSARRGFHPFRDECLQSDRCPYRREVAAKPAVRYTSEPCDPGPAANPYICSSNNSHRANLTAILRQEGPTLSRSAERPVTVSTSRITSPTVFT